MWPWLNAARATPSLALRGVLVAQGERGLVEVTLTGSQLVDYLDQLATDIGDGPLARREDRPMAQRMYTAIAPVVDRIREDAVPTEAPRAVIDDAALPSTPTVRAVARSSPGFVASGGGALAGLSR
ncbi:hypothetical protein ACFYXM_37055 [Streptomyces sp. NPDC002476]|uniref:hypothetical protein n=1 Tax=Streptomyces sp. NPDC002476 TaxID=3364648 RepID=UPI003677349B